MLSEEALVLYVAVVALGLLALGIWELLSPARRRFPERPAPRPVRTVREAPPPDPGAP